MENSPLDISNEVFFETKRAMSIHGSMRGLHEAYAVILEELDETWAEIKKKNPDLKAVRKELIQTAAMCVRAICDLNL